MYKFDLNLPRNEDASPKQEYLLPPLFFFYIFHWNAMKNGFFNMVNNKDKMSNLFRLNYITYIQGQSNMLHLKIKDKT